MKKREIKSEPVTLDVANMKEGETSLHELVMYGFQDIQIEATKISDGKISIIRIGVIQE